MNTDERQELILEKIATSIAHLDKILAVHAEKIAEHEKSDEKIFQGINDEMKGLRADLKIIKDIFTTFGKGKSFIITLAIVLGSIVAIGVSLKTILDWLKKLL